MSSLQNSRRRRGAWRFESTRVVLWMVIVVIVVFVTWAALSSIDQVTRATGQVIATARTQVIQSQDGGVIEEMSVKEGASVTQGQLLVRFNEERIRATYQEAAAKAAALQGAADRLQAEMLDKPLVFNAAVQAYPTFAENQRELYRKRRDAISDEIRSFQRALALAKEELASTEPLLQKGDIGLSEVIRLRRTVSDLESQIINRRNKYFQDTQAELAKTLEELASVSQVLAQRKLQLDNIAITAPLAGIVKNIRFPTVGAVVRPGEDILELVPSDDELLVEVKVRPADIGFIRPGLPAILKIDAYDYSVFGGLEGEIIYISADTLREENRATPDATYYVVRVRAKSRQLIARDGRKMEIIPGMTATAELVTGRRTIMNYLLKPVVKTMNEAMRER